MALIKCPECGKENVSDTAEQCPNCGYGIKEHFEREKRKAYYAEQQRILQEKEKAELDKMQAELNRELEKIDRLQPSQKPTEPSKWKHMFYYNDSLSMLSWAIIVGFVLFLLCFVSTGIFSILLAVLIVLGIPFAAYITYLDYDVMLNCYKRDYEDWKEQQSDWDGYIEKKKEEIRAKYKDVASNMAHYGTKTAPIPTIPIKSNQLKCPICGSTNVSRISTLNRGVSVATVGLASSKIGKQYECKKCKHKW